MEEKEAQSECPRFVVENDDFAMKGSEGGGLEVTSQLGSDKTIL